MIMNANTEDSPTIRFTLWGDAPGQGRVILLDGETMYSGKRATYGNGESALSFVRRWAQRAADDGVTSISLEMRRHTRKLGWYNGIGAPRGRVFQVRLT